MALELHDNIEAKLKAASATLGNQQLEQTMEEDMEANPSLLRQTCLSAGLGFPHQLSSRLCSDILPLDKSLPTSPKMPSPTRVGMEHTAKRPTSLDPHPPLPPAATNCNGELQKQKAAPGPRLLWHFEVCPQFLRGGE